MPLYPLYYDLSPREAVLRVIEMFDTVWKNVALGYLALGERDDRELITLCIRPAKGEETDAVLEPPDVPAGLYLGRQMIAPPLVKDLLRQIVEQGQITTRSKNNLSLAQFRATRRAVIDDRVRAHLHPKSLAVDGAALFLEGAHEASGSLQDRIRSIDAAFDPVRHSYNGIGSASEAILGLRIMPAGHVGVYYVVLPLFTHLTATEQIRGGGEIAGGSIRVANCKILRIDLQVPRTLARYTVRLRCGFRDGHIREVDPGGLAKETGGDAHRVSCEVPMSDDPGERIDEVSALIAGFPCAAAQPGFKMVPVPIHADHGADDEPERDSPGEKPVIPRVSEKQGGGGGVRVFYSYSHKDEKHRSKLETHLKPLNREGVIDTWHDRKITAGEKWDASIAQHLESADVVLLLVSADFLDSDYCYEKEMAQALRRHESGVTRVIPIIVRPCDWQTAPFGKLQALPKDGKAVVNWRRHDDAWTDVAKGIRKAVGELRR